MFGVTLRTMRCSLAYTASRGMYIPCAYMSMLKTTLSNSDLYHAEATKVLKSIEDRFMEDDLDLAFENNISSSSDVFNLQSEFGTWVLNKHNVTKQIWLSSPKSGPSKYNYHVPAGTDENTSTLDELKDGQWLNERDDTGSLYDLLTKEFSQTFNVDVQFDHKF